MTSNFVTYVVLIAVSCTIKGTQSTSNLYPRESVNREVKSLNGIWNFRTEPEASENIGFEDRWFEASLRTEKHDGHVIDMPVPSSYNDITQSAKLRDYVGWVWYDRSFYAPQSWLDNKKTVLLRFDSVNYYAAVYLNGINVVNHRGGHLPFSCDVTRSLRYNEPNLLTVAVNNELSGDTVPQGRMTYRNDTTRYPAGYKKLNLNFDFFNYAGIHRSVTLYAVPQVHISDVTIGTSIGDEQNGFSGRIDYNVDLDGTYGSDNEITCLVDIFDKYGFVKVASSTGCNGTIIVPNANLWWPVFTNPDPGYLYIGKIQLVDDSKVVDTYEQKIGIREIKLTNTSFLINNQPFYFRGFGKHEDSSVRGRGLDLPLIVKDINLIKWIGANSFRTSHYPYSEELMDETDKHGIVVIDECPAVGLNTFGDQLLQNHLKTVTEMIHRDKNRPSVVMWSYCQRAKVGGSSGHELLCQGFAACSKFGHFAAH
ncbi:Beta-glucuronidase [Halotydeus destructor]|nr:Beta-glucuronidase [Halotydeus destructor]